MTQVILVALPCVLTALCGYCTWVAQQSYKRKDMQSNALKVIMKAEMKVIYDRAHERKHIRSQDMGMYNDIYDVYHNMGGNGETTVWKAELERMMMHEQD